jgi:hypothetical protein
MVSHFGNSDEEQTGWDAMPMEVEENAPIHDGAHEILENEPIHR